MATIALITGATSGIGKAFAHELAAEHNDLVLIARGKDRLDQTADELQTKYGVNVETLQADLSTTEGVESVARRLSNESAPVDLLVNNAGFGSSKHFTEMTAAEHEEMIYVNVQAVVRLAHAALSSMIPRGHGDVIMWHRSQASCPAYGGRQRTPPPKPLSLRSLKVFRRSPPAPACMCRRSSPAS